MKRTGMLDGFFYSNFNRIFQKQTEDNLIRCHRMLLRSGSALFGYIHKKDARLIWVNERLYTKSFLSIVENNIYNFPLIPMTSFYDLYK